MATFSIQRSNDSKAWQIFRQREGVSATVWEHVSLPFPNRFRTVGGESGARVAGLRWLGVVAWIKRIGRGNAVYYGRDGSGWTEPRAGGVGNGYRLSLAKITPISTRKRYPKQRRPHGLLRVCQRECRS